MSMNDFPPELIELTLGLIKSNKKRRTLRLVCKKWLKYLGIVYFDIDIILRRHVRPISNTLFRCSQPFSVKLNKADKLSSIDYNILFGNVSNMISVEILFKKAFLHRGDVFDINLGFANLIKLQRLVIPHHNISIEYLKLPNVTNLEVNTIYFKDPNCFPNLQRLWLRDYHIPISLVAPKLTALKFNGIISSDSEYEFVKSLRVLHLSTILRFKERSFPNLEELQIIKCDSIGQCDKLTKLHIVLADDVRFIRKLTSLQDLVLKIAGDTVLIESNLTVLKSIQQLNSFEASCVPEDGFKGKFLEYLPPDTLTRLVFSLSADRLNDRIALFTNLQRLEMVLEEEPDLVILSNFVNLTKLMISADYIYNLNMQWVSHLTALISLSITHIQKEEEKPDLNTLTNLTKLKFVPQGSILPIPNLTKLRTLIIEAAEDYSCLLNMPKLTSLQIDRCSESPIDHVIQIPKLCKLTLNIFSNDQIKAFTALKKLTQLVLYDRKKECNPDPLTLLTHLQIAKMIGYQGSSGMWTPKNSPKINKKLPYALN